MLQILTLGEKNPRFSLQVLEVRKPENNLSYRNWPGEGLLFENSHDHQNYCPWAPDILPPYLYLLLLNCALGTEARNCIEWVGGCRPLLNDFETLCKEEIVAFFKLCSGIYRQRRRNSLKNPRVHSISADIWIGHLTHRNQNHYCLNRFLTLAYYTCFYYLFVYALLKSDYWTTIRKEFERNWLRHVVSQNPCIKWNDWGKWHLQSRWPVYCLSWKLGTSE